MEEIGKSIHVKIFDEQIVSKAEIVWVEDARGFKSQTTRECLRLDYQRSDKDGCKD